MIVGNWNINIQGTGAHHNDKAYCDADLLAVEFVAYLRSKGQLVESASFTSGGKLDLLEAAKPLMTMQRCVLNGRERDMPAVLTYDMIRMAANQGPRPTVTYHKARFGKEGILSPGQSIEVCEGTGISAMDTGNA